MGKTAMRKLVPGCTVLLDGIGALACYPTVTDAATPSGVRSIALLLASLLLAAALLMLLAHLAILPPRATTIMLAVCIGLPLVWLVGMFMVGIFSAGELAMVLLPCAFAAANWYAFRFSAARTRTNPAASSG